MGVSARFFRPPDVKAPPRRKPGSMHSDGSWPAGTVACDGFAGESVGWASGSHPGAIMPTILKIAAAAVACVALLAGCDGKPEPTKPRVAAELPR